MNDVAPRAVTPEQAARRALFVTACRVLTYRDRARLRAELLGRGALRDENDGRRFDDNPLAWVLAVRADPVRFDAFWLLVEEQHAEFLAAAAASSQP